ncbi:MAG: hypothetical protein L6R37_008022, partial [Teloschistes peruensis]
VLLFCFSTDIANGRAITIDADQTWDVVFQFPWAVMPHPTQDIFGPSSAFPHEAHHRPPPTWQQRCHGQTQSVQYYLEVSMNRRGRFMDHTDIDQLPLLFCPPLDIPNPATFCIPGPRGTIVRTTRKLDPEKRKEHYGFLAKTKDLLSSSNRDPSAVFRVVASAPTVCCLGGQIPITLCLIYIKDSSTAPEQPEVIVSNLFARISSFVQYRVVRRYSELSRHSKTKTVIAYPRFARSVVYDGMSLDELAPLSLPSTLDPSFATFSVSMQYILKISAKFSCAGKDFDIVLVNHPLTVHPARSMYRPFPNAQPRLEPRIESRYQDDEDGMDALPRYQNDEDGMDALPQYSRISQ